MCTKLQCASNNILNGTDDAEYTKKPTYRRQK